MTKRLQMPRDVERRTAKNRPVREDISQHLAKQHYRAASTNSLQFAESLFGGRLGAQDMQKNPTMHVCKCNKPAAPAMESQKMDEFSLHAIRMPGSQQNLKKIDRSRSDAAILCPELVSPETTSDERTKAEGA